MLRLSRDGLAGPVRTGDLDGVHAEGWDGPRKCPEVSDAERLSLRFGGWIGMVSSRGEIADTGLKWRGACCWACSGLSVGNLYACSAAAVADPVLWRAGMAGTGGASCECEPEDLRDLGIARGPEIELERDRGVWLSVDAMLLCRGDCVGVGSDGCGELGVDVVS